MGCNEGGGTLLGVFLVLAGMPAPLVGFAQLGLLCLMGGVCYLPLSRVVLAIGR